jgi:magnesium transporter
VRLAPVTGHLPPQTSNCKGHSNYLYTYVHRMWISGYALLSLEKGGDFMIFLSDLLRRSIVDNDHRRVGSVRDVCVSLDETFPVVTALVVHSSGNGEMMIPWSQVATVEGPEVRLNINKESITPYIPHTEELLLKRDILDKQIVDTQGFRVVKVNDLKLAQIKRTARLVGVDISLSGLLRRLGLQATIDRIGRVVPLQLPERTITWNYVEPIQMVGAHTGQLALAGTAAATVGAVGVIPKLQLNVSHNKLTDLHPADIADILEQLDVEEAGAMLERLDMETAADTLNEVEYPLQSELISELDPERASDLLERLAPDDAADILAEMAPAEAEHLLNLMPTEESRPIRDLLRYDAETAGGIMTPEYLALSETSTVEDALTYLRQHSEHLEMVYYLYVIDEQHHLKGVVSLRQLVVAEPTTRIADLKDPDVIKVRVDTDQEEVARIIAKYDLLGVPVVDEEDHLVGLVTVDDVIDVIHEEQAEDLSDIVGADVEESEEEEKFSWATAARRTIWPIVNVIAGFVLALVLAQAFAPLLAHTTALVSLVGSVSDNRLSLALGGLFCLVPMLLLTSGSASSQALGIAGWNLRSTRGRDLWKTILRELLIGTFSGIVVSILAGIAALVLFHTVALSLVAALGFGFTQLIAYFCGLGLPNLLQRLRLRGSLITAPLLDPVISVISLGVFLTVTIMLIERVAL